MPRGCFCTLIFLDRFEEGLLVGSGSGKGGSSWSEDSPSVGSSLLARLPCLELLWTNMLSDTASWGPSTETCVEITTWNLLMSRGFPAFLRQFWLHFRKNLRKYRSMITGSEGVSFLLPQLFLSQHRLRLWQTKGEKQNRKKSVTLFLRKKKDLTRTFLKALVVDLSTKRKTVVQVQNTKQECCYWPAHDFVSEEYSTHFRVLVLSFVYDGLSSYGVNQSDVQILFLSDSWSIQELQSIVDTVVGLDSVCFHVLFDESNKSRPFDLYRLVRFVIKSDHEVEEVTFSQIRRRMLLEGCSRQSNAVLFQEYHE